jgi:uncharacterized protein YbjT (DUF2867 family)
MILITGAAGKTGLSAIRALAVRGGQVRAFVRNQQQADRAAAAGAFETVVGDLRDRDPLEIAARGARVVYHICPNLSEDEIGIGLGVIAAAAATGLQHLVYHSVLHPQTEAMPHHWLKLSVEAALFESGVPFTILQPAAYMQNVLAGWDEIVNQGVYRVPYAVETRLGMVDLEDVAQAAAAVLTDSGHEGAIYELAGSQVLTQVEVAERLGRALGRPVRAVQMPVAEWTRQAVSAGLGDYQVDALLKMFAYYESFGFWGNPRALSHLLGRSPTTFEAFLQRTIREKAS